MKEYIKDILGNLPLFGPYFCVRFKNHKHRFKFSSYLKYRILPRKSLYWECDHRSEVTGKKNILVGISDSPGKNVPGCYFQGRSGIITGGYNYYAPNVCIVSENHDIRNLTRAIPNRPILIGSYNWFGFGCVVLPGIQIGDHVVIGANSVVTKNIPSYCVVAGVPARIIRKLNKDEFENYNDSYEAYGFIPLHSLAGQAMKKKRRHELREYESNYGPILSEELREELSNE